MGKPINGVGAERDQTESDCKRKPIIGVVGTGGQNKSQNKS
jgi:hypothetical protein